MFLLSLKNILRNRSVIFALLLLFVLGITSVVIGRQFIQKQQRAIRQTTKFQQEQIDRNVTFFDKEMGLLLYYLKFSVVNNFEPITALSIGQRDVEPTIKSLTIRGLEAQVYDTDLNNPNNLLSGNLDLGFVIIYLFPLLIISLSYTIYSEEVELGTWSLVHVQTKSKHFFLVKKLFVIMMLVFLTLFVLLFFAVIILDILFDSRFLFFLITSFLYLLFWFALCFFIVSFKKNSSGNAIILLSIWLCLTILIPAFINNYVINKYPIPEALSTLVKQRDGYHNKWDLDKKQTVEKFYEIYPQFRKYELPDKTFSYFWYYGMQHMGDFEAQNDSKIMRQKIIERQQFSNDFGMFIPSIHTQLLFNDIALSGSENQMQFLDYTRKFHEDLRLHFYPKIFEQLNVNEHDWKQYKVDYYNQRLNINWFESLLPFLVAILILTICSILFIRFN